MNARHVVFGTGQVGRLLAERLVAQGLDVVAVNRSGRGDLPGARLVSGDATDESFTRAVCAGAAVVYFCLNAGRYDRWEEEFPPLQRGVLAGAAAAGARLVVLENLYAYGEPQGRALVETMAASPTSRKAATRAAMSEQLLHAHREGRVEVAIGRASDYFGPGTLSSALGETVFGTAVAGKRAQVMGDPDLLHSYSYTPDVAAGLAVLGVSTVATGRAWHLPVAPARTTRRLVADIYALADREPRLIAAGPTALRAFGLLKPPMREYLHTLYQFTGPWVVDDTAFRTTFDTGVTEHATDLDQALATTLAWFRSAGATTPAH